MSFRLKNKIRELDDKVNDAEFDNSNLRFDLSNAESTAGNNIIISINYSIFYIYKI